MQGVYIMESNKTGNFYELSLGRYDSNRDYLRTVTGHLEEVSEAAFSLRRSAEVCAW